MNAWNGPIQNQWETVWAGGIPSSKADPYDSVHSAAVFVSTGPSDPNASGGQMLGTFAPQSHPTGEFSVVSEQNDRLVLALSGTSVQYSFNLDTLSYN